MGNPVGWFEIYVDDMTRAKSFYQGVLEVTLEKLESPTEQELDMWCFPGDNQGYGATGALVKMADVKAGGNSTLVYFNCDDCAVEESRVASSGGTVQMPKMAIGEYGFISIVVDTEGNTIGLHSKQ